MWEKNDKQNYTNLTKNNIGQIYDDEFYNEILSYASNKEYKTFLEIGTWNGLGSTKAFAQGFKNRDDDYIFYSLECNKEKCRDAALLYQDNNKINILNEVIWNKLPDNFYEIFPQSKTNNLFKEWNEVDINNMKDCNLFLERTNLPKYFDIVLLDGGEFTTYHEFQILKDKIRILMLDDITVDKCKLIVKELEDSSDKWKILKKSDVRNGFLIAQHII